MRTQHPRRIKAGIPVARMAPRDVAWILTFNHPPRLTVRAYQRESMNVLKRVLRWSCISTAEVPL